MRVTVIGQITKDTLIFPDTPYKVQSGLGGSLYTVFALSALSDCTINLVCNVGYDVYDRVLEILSHYPNINLAGLQKTEYPNIHSYILFASEYGTQFDEGNECPVSYAQVAPFIKESDFILISPMTGFDIELRTLRLIRKRTQTPLLLDYHILALGRDKLGNRFLKVRKNWFEWCTSCDYLQLNKFEAESISGFPINTENDMFRFCEGIIKQGVKSVAITLGKNGSLVCYKEGVQIKVAKIDPNAIFDVVDTTGCGDVYAASFLINLFKTGDVETSYRFASRIAGIKSGVTGFDGLSKFFAENQLVLE